MKTTYITTIMTCMLSSYNEHVPTTSTSSTFYQKSTIHQVQFQQKNLRAIIELNGTFALLICTCILLYHIPRRDILVLTFCVCCCKHLVNMLTKKLIHRILYKLVLVSFDIGMFMIPIFRRLCTSIRALLRG